MQALLRIKTVLNFSYDKLLLSNTTKFMYFFSTVGLEVLSKYTKSVSQTFNTSSSKFYML